MPSSIASPDGADLSLTEPDPETRDLLARMGAMLAAPPAAGLSPIAAARRRASEIFLAFAGPPEGAAAQRDLVLAGGAGPRLARLYTPDALPASERPLILFLHGGGWTMGGLDDYDGLLSSLCAFSGAGILSLDYRLAPEHHFPAAAEDAIAALGDIQRRAAEFGGRPDLLAIMGDSAGGNLAAVAAAAAGKAGIRLAAQFLLYPMLDVSRPHEAYPSRTRYGDGRYFLANAALDASRLAYAGADDLALAADSRFSPLMAPDLRDLPPTRLFVGALDPLRDEARLYAERLRAAGISVQLHEFPGAIHAFLSFGVLAHARAGRRFLAAEIARTFARVPP